MSAELPRPLPIKLFLAYLRSKIKETYYFFDMLREIAQGANQKGYVQYRDWMTGNYKKQQVKKEEKTGEQIIDDLINMLG